MRENKLSRMKVFIKIVYNLEVFPGQRRELVCVLSSLCGLASCNKTRRIKTNSFKKRRWVTVFSKKNQ